MKAPLLVLDGKGLEVRAGVDEPLLVELPVGVEEQEGVAEAELERVLLALLLGIIVVSVGVAEALVAVGVLVSVRVLPEEEVVVSTSATEMGWPTSEH